MQKIQGVRRMSGMWRIRLNKGHAERKTWCIFIIFLSVSHSWQHWKLSGFVVAQYLSVLELRVPGSWLGFLRQSIIVVRSVLQVHAISNQFRISKYLKHLLTLEFWPIAHDSYVPWPVGATSHGLRSEPPGFGGLHTRKSRLWRDAAESRRRGGQRRLLGPLGDWFRWIPCHYVVLRRTTSYYVAVPCCSQSSIISAAVGGHGPLSYRRGRAMFSPDIGLESKCKKNKVKNSVIM